MAMFHLAHVAVGSMHICAEIFFNFMSGFFKEVGKIISMISFKSIYVMYLSILVEYLHVPPHIRNTNRYIWWANGEFLDVLSKKAQKRRHRRVYYCVNRESIYVD